MKGTEWKIISTEKISTALVLKRLGLPSRRRQTNTFVTSRNIQIGQGQMNSLKIAFLALCLLLNKIKFSFAKGESENYQRLLSKLGRYKEVYAEPKKRSKKAGKNDQLKIDKERKINSKPGIWMTEGEKRRGAQSQISGNGRWTIAQFPSFPPTPSPIPFLAPSPSSMFPTTASTLYPTSVPSNLPLRSPSSLPFHLLTTPAIGLTTHEPTLSFFPTTLPSAESPSSPPSSIFPTPIDKSLPPTISLGPTDPLSKSKVNSSVHVQSQSLLPQSIATKTSIPTGNNTTTNKPSLRQSPNQQPSLTPSRTHIPIENKTTTSLPSIRHPSLVPLQTLSPDGNRTASTMPTVKQTSLSPSQTPMQSKNQTATTQPSSIQSPIPQSSLMPSTNSIQPMTPSINSIQPSSTPSINSIQTVNQTAPLQQTVMPSLSTRPSVAQPDASAQNLKQSQTLITTTKGFSKLSLPTASLKPSLSAPPNFSPSGFKNMSFVSSSLRLPSLAPTVPTLKEPVPKTPVVSKEQKPGIMKFPTASQRLSGSTLSKNVTKATIPPSSYITASSSLASTSIHLPSTSPSSTSKLPLPLVPSFNSRFTSVYQANISEVATSLSSADFISVRSGPYSVSYYVADGIIAKHEDIVQLAVMTARYLQNFMTNKLRRSLNLQRLKRLKLFNSLAYLHDFQTNLISSLIESDGTIQVKFESTALFPLSAPDIPSLQTVIDSLGTAFSQDNSANYMTELMDLPETNLLKSCTHFSFSADPFSATPIPSIDPRKTNSLKLSEISLNYELSIGISDVKPSDVDLTQLEQLTDYFFQGFMMKNFQTYLAENKAAVEGFGLDASLLELADFRTRMVSISLLRANVTSIHFEMTALFFAISPLLPSAHLVESRLIPVFAGDSEVTYVQLLESLPPKNMFSKTISCDLEIKGMPAAPFSKNVAPFYLKYSHASGKKANESELQSLVELTYEYLKAFMLHKFGDSNKRNGEPQSSGIPLVNIIDFNSTEESPFLISTDNSTIVEFDSQIWFEATSIFTPSVVTLDAAIATFFSGESLSWYIRQLHESLPSDNAFSEIFAALYFTNIEAAERDGLYASQNFTHPLSENDDLHKTIPVVLDHFALQYSVEKFGEPTADDLADLTSVTDAYVMGFIAEFYVGADVLLASVDTVFVSFSMEHGGFITTEFKSTATFLLGSPIIPSATELNLVRADSFSAENLSGYVGMLNQLPTSNVYASTISVNSDRGPLEDDKRRNATAIAGGSAAVVILIAGFLMFKQRVINSCSGKACSTQLAPDSLVISIQDCSDETTMFIRNYDEITQAGKTSYVGSSMEDVYEIPSEISSCIPIWVTTKERKEIKDLGGKSYNEAILRLDVLGGMTFR